MYTEKANEFTYNEKYFRNHIRTGFFFRIADFSINSGEKIGVIGINGTGKSTLLKMIACIDSCDAGLVVKGKMLL